MATIIKLQRRGAPHKAYWRIVVTDSREPGGCIELLGTYAHRRRQADVTLNEEKAAQWLARGAQPSPAVKRLLLDKGLFARAKAAARS